MSIRRGEEAHQGAMVTCFCLTCTCCLHIVSGQGGLMNTFFHTGIRSAHSACQHTRADDADRPEVTNRRYEQTARS